jgi:hypothetical protein
MSMEDLLTRTFAEVAEAADHPNTAMATVVARSRAARAHRLRRIAYVAAAAVVVVGGLSAAVALRGGDDTTPTPAGSLGDLPQGAPPKIDYLDGDTFVTTTGERFTSHRFVTAAGAVAWRNGVLVASRPSARHPFSTISFVTKGSSSNVGCGTQSFAVSADIDPVYWLASGCKANRGGRFVQGTTSTDTAKGAILSPVGRVAGGIVAAATSTGLRLPSHALVIPPGNSRWVPLPLLIPRGASAAADLVTGIKGRNLDSVVVDARTGDVRWRAPLWTLSRFSASGRYIVGDQDVGEQTVETVGDVIGIFDAATGRPVLDKPLPGLTFDSLPVWEGDDAVLVVAHDDDGEQAIVRIGLDGSVSRATDVGDGSSGGFKPSSTP